MPCVDMPAFGGRSAANAAASKLKAAIIVVSENANRRDGARRLYIVVVSLRKASPRAGREGTSLPNGVQLDRGIGADVHPHVNVGRAAEIEDKRRTFQAPIVP